MLENTGAWPHVVDPTQFSGDERRSQDLNNVKLNTILAASTTESEGSQTYLGECGVRDLQTEAVQHSVRLRVREVLRELVDCHLTGFLPQTVNNI